VTVREPKYARLFTVPLAATLRQHTRHSWICAAWMSIAILCLWPARLTAQTDAPPLAAEVESIGLVVGDIDRSVEFYSRVLSFRQTSDVEIAGPEYERLYGVFGLRMRVVRMTLGDEAITLTEYLVPKGRPVPADSRSNDRWFQHFAIITSDMDRAYRRLREHKVEHASTGPQRLPDWNPNAGGIRAFYFKDPDGHPLEILQFPPGKGNDKWHRPGDRLFLGIDHTAIVVNDTEASLAFYRDQLGMKVAGESENFGDEQEHLNNVFGARLRITALRAATGPGIELLEYLSPRTGRTFPGPLMPNDLAGTQVRIVVRGVEQLEPGLRLAKRNWVSPGAVALMTNDLDAAAGLTLRDPDGHILNFVVKDHAR